MMRFWLYLTLLFSSLVTAGEVNNTPLNSVFAPADSEQVKQVETFAFKNSSEQTRAINLARELRCPQCLNQNLMESNSPIAKDLRLIVYQMVDKGKTNTQIIDFMTSRFGDFVLYNPKFEARTYLLWLGPFLLLLVFAIVGIVVVKKAMLGKEH
ncbi:heme lyase NrfEFG subunit NrfF [Psychromonas ossibalaenae]|uniref:heme lyase NrfEFG subunit NrfF n=1 Tax=Psychromonas ossibalaenae TaxID=444922 RepID=UPI0003732602|nr:heme lyase NrfEFG subunit NrfF [Psychromonas ossibalaenae]